MMRIAVKQILLFASICSFSYILMSVSFAGQSSENDNTQKKTNQALSQVQQKISQQQKSIKQTSNKRSSLEKKLRYDDISIAKIATSIINTQKDRQKTQQTLKNLAKKKVSLTSKKQQQEKILAQQLRAAYTSGHHNYIKLLLNQEKPASVERTVTYYKYLNDARTKEIDQFQIVLSDLLAITTKHQEQAIKLNTLKQEQAKQKITFQQSKKARKNTIRALNKELLNKQKKSIQ